MIQALTPVLNAVIADAFLMKVAEQGFGVPARQLLSDGQSYMGAFQERVGQLTSSLHVRCPLSLAHLALLNPIEYTESELGNYPRVDEHTANSLLQLLKFQDTVLPTVAGAGLLVGTWTPFTSEFTPWFLELHRLESAGVLTGIRENRDGDYIPTFGRTDPSREFVIDADRLNEFRGDRSRFHNLVTITSRAMAIDKDAEDLYRQISV